MPVDQNGHLLAMGATGTIMETGEAFTIGFDGWIQAPVKRGASIVISLSDGRTFCGARSVIREDSEVIIAAPCRAGLRMRL